MNSKRKVRKILLDTVVLISSWTNIGNIKKNIILNCNGFILLSLLWNSCSYGIFVFHFFLFLSTMQYDITLYGHTNIILNFCWFIFDIGNETVFLLKARNAPWRQLSSKRIFELSRSVWLVISSKHESEIAQFQIK